MIELENAYFKGYGNILVELENGEQIECYSNLRTVGDYREWWEDIHPDGIGYLECFVEQDPFEEDAEIIDLTDYETYDGEKGKIKIKKLIKCIDVNWEAQI